MDQPLHGRRAACSGSADWLPHAAVSRAAGAASPASAIRARVAGTAILAAINFDPLDPARVGVEHFGFEVLWSGHQFAAYRYVAGSDHQITAERVDFARGLAEVEFVRRSRPGPLEAGAAVGNDEPSLCRVTPAPLRSRVRRRCRRRSARPDLPSTQPVGAAVFIDDQREMDACRLHLGEQIERRHGWRRVEDFTNDLGGYERQGKIDVREIRSACCGLFALARQRPDRCAARAAM